MSLRDRLVTLENGREIPEGSKVRVHPTGWEPGYVYDPTSGGTLTAGPYENEIDDAIWDQLIEDWGLNRETTEIVPDSVQVRAWDSNLGEGVVKRFKYYRAALRPRQAANNKLDMEKLYLDVRKAKKSLKKATKSGDSTLLVNLSDWQIGNGDFGGVQAQIEAIANLVEAVPQRVADLRRSGESIGCVTIAGLGDLIENTCGFYAAQTYRVDVDLREQRKIVRRGIRDITMEIVKHVDDVKVICVPGNHGETRQKGKSITAVGDNHDVAVFEEVAEILSINPDVYGHVQWRIPADEMAIAVELSGQLVAFTHGHAARGSGEASKTMWTWWKDQAMGRRYPGVADASILVAGHFHHLNIKEQEGRALFVCPSLTKVSEYWADSKGETTAAGTLTFQIRPDGWGNLCLL